MGDDLALVEDDDALGEREDHLHDVLDDDERDAHGVDRAHELDRLMDLGRGEPGEGLVEEDQTRLGREHARDAEALAPRRAQAPCRLLGNPLEPGHGQHAPCRRARVGLARMAQEGAHHHVLEDGELLEGRGQLERTPDAEARMRLRRDLGHVVAVEEDPSSTRLEVAGEAIEEGRFACPVRPDQADDLALADLEAGVRDRKEAAEGLADVGGFKQHGYLRSGWGCCGRCARRGAPGNAPRPRSARPAHSGSAA